MNGLIHEIPLWQFAIGSTLIGFILGVRFSTWYFNALIDNDIKNGNVFIFRDGKWFPHSPFHKEEK